MRQTGALVVLAAAALVAAQITQTTPLMEPQTLVAVVVAAGTTQTELVVMAVLVSSWSATALHNFLTGERHETIDFGHRCGPHLDGLRYKPRRLLQGYRSP
jgi:hypothetical protein